MTSQTVCSLLSLSQLLSPLSTTAKILFLKPTEAELCCFLSCPNFNSWPYQNQLFKKWLCEPSALKLLQDGTRLDPSLICCQTILVSWQRSRDIICLFWPRQFRCWFGASAYSGTTCCILLNWTWTDLGVYVRNPLWVRKPKDNDNPSQHGMWHNRSTGRSSSNQLKRYILPPSVVESDILPSINQLSPGACELGLIKLWL